MDGFAIYAIFGTLVCIFGIYAAYKAASPWGIELKLNEEQIRAASKRFADAAEKLGIGCFLYWIFQERTEGLLLTIFCLGASLIITIRDATR